MKKYSLAIGFLASVFTLATPVRAQTGATDTCQPLVGYPDNVTYPEFNDGFQQLSPDGKMLVYSINDGDAGAYVLNLRTLHRTRLVGKGGFQNEFDDWWGYWTWCPYDSDLIAFDVEMSESDTADGVSSFFTGQIFKERISTGESQLITPQAGGPLRGASLAHSSYFGEKQNWDWLPGSKPGMDSFVIKYYYPGMTLDSGFYGIYVQQTQKLIQWYRPVDIGGNTVGILRYSHNKSDSIYQRGGYYLDTSLIHVPFPLDTSEPPIKCASFSPNDSLFALGVLPIGAAFIFPDTANQPLVLIYKASDPSKPIYTINFQKLFCKYGEGCPEFLTDSTFAVSMYTDGDNYDPLWELTIDGRVVRQLTDLPQSSVALPAIPASAVSLLCYPDPITSTTTISFDLPEQEHISLKVYDELGIMRSVIFDGARDAGQNSIPFAGPSLANGVYTVVLTTPEETKTGRIIIER
jgi:hypothetical protein